MGILAKRMFSFSIIVLNMKLLVILFIMEKKNICQGKFLVHPIQVTGSTYCGNAFQTTYTSKIHT